MSARRNTIIEKIVDKLVLILGQFPKDVHCCVELNLDRQMHVRDHLNGLCVHKYIYNIAMYYWVCTQ